MDTIYNCYERHGRKDGVYRTVQLIRYAARLLYQVGPNEYQIGPNDAEEHGRALGNLYRRAYSLYDDGAHPIDVWDAINIGLRRSRP